jgi:hypothetical protein
MKIPRKFLRFREEISLKIPVTGTATEETTKDYIRNLNEAVVKSNQAVTRMLHEVLKSEKDTHYAVHNPLAWGRKEFVSIVIDSPDAIVTDHHNRRVISQVKSLRNFANYPYDFLWQNIPPLILQSFVLYWSNEKL